jgi:hypothetical protein
MNGYRKWPRALMALFILPVLLAACGSPTEERIWLKASGWNRARVVGNTLVGQPVPMALDNAGNVYLFLIDQENDTLYPRVVALNREAEVLWNSSYDIALAQPAHPKILWDGEELQLFWLSDRRLYHAPLGPAAVLSEPPALLSAAVRVDTYDVALSPAGDITVWFAGPRREPGLYALPPGDLGGEAVLVDPQGIRPGLRYDDAGTLHTTWAHHPPGYGTTRFFYAAYAGGSFHPGRETKVVSPVLGPTSVLHGPTLGIDAQQAYLFWVSEIRTGMEAGRVNIEYVHFPLSDPAAVSPPLPLFVPSGYRLTYEPPSGGTLQAGQRVPLEGRGTSRIRDVASNPVFERELAIAFRVQLPYLRRKSAEQVSVAFLKDGTPTAYQLLTFTPRSTADPAVVSDADGHLYATWLEKGALPGSMVYFASTAPDIREALGHVTWADAARLGGETLFGLAGGALFLPLVLVWLVAPMIVLGLTSRLRGEDERLSGVGTLISLGLAMAAYWAGKLLTIPGMRDYVPFSAWLPVVPSWLNLPLQVGVPLLIAGLALGLAWRFTYGRGNRSVLFFMLLHVAIDGVMTMAVYGVILFGAF